MVERGGEGLYWAEQQFSVLPDLVLRLFTTLLKREIENLVYRISRPDLSRYIVSSITIDIVSVWKSLFGKEADKLEQANDDDKTYYIIEKEPLVNTFISVPKENSTLNCASFTAGMVEAILTHSGFPAKVTAHWHKGTTLMIKFDEAVIARDKQLDSR
uniref:Trafficking protein particle complex 5 n=1 Tax=Astyanax mexicanus TaxID=7994 RepID=A0A8B9HBT3_ASTMX